jgi:hypothetical protein
VGKTLLLRSLLEQTPTVLYCDSSATTQVVFRSVARALLERGAPRIQQTCRNHEGIEARSAVSLKGIVMDALREGSHSIVLDHLHRPSPSFAAAVREIIGWCSTPVIAVARSSHMEDTGYLQALYSDRQDRYELKNFGPVAAGQFAHTMVERTELSAPNITEFLGKVLELSQGNPGAILSLVQMAKHPKYRSQEYIKISLLYIDFRMRWSPAVKSR